MGYCTNYSLDIKGDQAQIAKAEYELGKNEDAVYAFGELFDGDGELCKWYGHEQDMIEISKKYPDLIFTLSGCGEESEDQWIKYFSGGKIQIEYVKIIPPDSFDPTKLKTLSE
jgi:hypothetical protein